jgi:pimeloyl-ACP methyl ester carboxylesterase
MSGMPYKARTLKYIQDASFTVRYLRAMRPSYKSRRVFLKEAAPLLKGRTPHFGTQTLAKAKLHERNIWSPSKGAITEEILLDTSTRDLSAAYLNYRGPLHIMKAEIASRYLSEEQLEKIQELRPDVHVDRISKSGHSIHLEQPELWKKSLRNFLEITEFRS